jgi:hypothetical protein
MQLMNFESPPFAESAERYPGILDVFTGTEAIQKAARLVQFRAEKAYSGAFVALPPKSNPAKFDWTCCRGRHIAIRPAGKPLSDEAALKIATLVIQRGALSVTMLSSNGIVQARKIQGGVKWLEN